MKHINAPLRTSFSRPVRFRSSIAGLIVLVSMTFTLFLSGGRVVKADTAIGNVAAGTAPVAVAVNPVTNKIYVVNNGSNNVTVIDGTNNSTTTVAVGTNPFAVAVNPVTNKIYVANNGSSNVTVIDGVTNSTTPVVVGSFPNAVAINPVTNKIYVVSNGSVTVIDGTNNSTTAVATGGGPQAIAVNPATNKIYVANGSTNNVTVIDGTNNSTTTVAVGSSPTAIAVNPATNKIYVVNNGSNNVTVIDGTNNSTTTVPTGSTPFKLAVNPATNKIYVANRISNNVTVIDGTNNSTTTVAVGTQPFAVAVNPVTNKIYVANGTSNNVTVIDGTNNSATTVAAGTTPTAVAVNPVTNKIYVANQNSNNVTVIDGSYNTTATVAAGGDPFDVAVNPVTNRIYVANNVGNNVTVIDGTNNSPTNVAVGTGPRAVAVNPITNKIYVANGTSDNVTVIDGTNNSTTTVAAGSQPIDIEVNPVTNKIYVANFGSPGTVTVIDGTNNSTTTVGAGFNPRAVAINPATNKIYVANNVSNDVTVIDGTNNSTTTVTAGTNPRAVAVNPVTNKIYVANYNGGNPGDVTVIDGTNNSTTTVAAGPGPIDVTVNPVTNKIYVANNSSANVTVIDGTTNSTTTVPTGSAPFKLAVNPATNKIYVINPPINAVTVIDGTNNSTTNVAVGSVPDAVAVNAVTNKIYTANRVSANATVITSAPTNSIPLNTTVAPLPGNTTTMSNPTFTLTATSTYSPNAPPPQNIYFQMDTLINPFLRAAEQSRTAATLTADATTPTLQPGIHILYFFATDGSDATSINPVRPFEEKFNEGFDMLAPESSPIIGGINAYTFLVASPTPTPTPAFTISGFVTRGGSLFSNVTITLSGSTNATTTTNIDGNYSFAALAAGGNYTVTPSKTNYTFNPPSQTFNNLSANQTANFTATPTCTFSISPTSQNSVAGGGTGSVSVTTAIACNWTAVSNDGWITITSGASGSGNGAVNYSVAANSGPARSGTITIAGQTFTVTQDSGCTFSINPTSQNFAASGGTGNVGVITASGCGWTAASNAGWITVTSGASGNGTAGYSVAANSGAARSGTITIAGQTFTVTQDAPGNTPTGSNVTVQLGGIAITFDRVIVSGYTTVLLHGPPIIPLPAGYAVFRNLSFDITTTATIASVNGPPIRVSFALDRLQIGPPITPQVFSTLRVFHGENGVFVDRTLQGPPIQPGPPIMPIFAGVNSLGQFVIAQTVNTPVGSNVTVELGGITITFDRVTVAGNTTVLHVGPPIIPLPAGFAVFRNLSFDITTTATIASLNGPPIRVSFALDRLQHGPPITPQVFSTLRVFHGENGAFVDRTIPSEPIIPGNPVMPPLIARVSSLSPFVIAQQPPQAVLQSVLDDLRTLRQTITDKQDGKKLDDAIRSLTRALEPNLWLDPAHLQSDDGKRVFNETKDAVGKLSNLIHDRDSSIQDRDGSIHDRDSSIHDRDSSIPDATLQGFIDRIVDADRRLAQTAINDAIAAGGNQQNINKATRELSEGDAEAAAGRFNGAIEHYREAWKHALEAMDKNDQAALPNGSDSVSQLLLSECLTRSPVSILSPIRCRKALFIFGQADL